MEKTYSSIQMTEGTKERLRKIGRMGDSYEDIIIRLLGKAGNRTKKGK